jgi:nucleobase:cation symporter-1, NCS1 family
MTQAARPRESRFAVESHGIDYIPPSDRHGRPVSLLPFWFAGNVQITLVAIGAIAPVLGLNLAWSLISLVVGNVVGALFMAYHSAQGPRLGLPQMIQSRAQFGFLGAIVPLIVAVLMYMAFFITSAILGGEALAGLIHVSNTLGIVLVSIVTIVLTWAGYDIFHSLARPISIASGIMFVALTIRLVGELPVHVHATGVTPGHVLLAISIAATGQITWAPYVSDYSRYLPESTSARKTFAYTYIGSAIGGSWMECLGAIAVLVSANAFANGSVFMAGQFPAVRWLLLLVIIVGVVFVNMENLYGTFLTSLAGLSPSGTFASGRTLRLVFTTVAGAVGTLFAVLASANLIVDLENFLLFLLYLMVPWTAINLTDYYLIRRGEYSIPEFFKADGAFGRVNVFAVALFAVTVLIEVPFMNTALFVGPVANALGGADIAWLVGLFFAGGVYYLVKSRTAQLPAVRQRAVENPVVLPAADDR